MARCHWYRRNSSLIFSYRFGLCNRELSERIWSSIESFHNEDDISPEDTYAILSRLSRLKSLSLNLFSASFIAPCVAAIARNAQTLTFLRLAIVVSRRPSRPVPGRPDLVFSMIGAAPEAESAPASVDTLAEKMLESLSTRLTHVKTLQCFFFDVDTILDSEDDIRRWWRLFPALEYLFCIDELTDLTWARLEQCCPVLHSISHAAKVTGDLVTGELLGAFPSLRNRVKEFSSRRVLDPYGLNSLLAGGHFDDAVSLVKRIAPPLVGLNLPGQDSPLLLQLGIPPIEVLSKWLDAGLGTKAYVPSMPSALFLTSLCRS